MVAKRRDSNSRFEERELADKITATRAVWVGASEETLTLDLFLGKEAL